MTEAETAPGTREDPIDMTSADPVGTRVDVWTDVELSVWSPGLVTKPGEFVTSTDETERQFCVWRPFEVAAWAPGFVISAVEPDGWLRVRRLDAPDTSSRLVPPCAVRPATTGPAEEPGPLVIESCHSTWIFDTARRRFRRVLKGMVVAGERPVTEWRPYETLEMMPHSDTFVVTLNPERTRMLRSWRHLGSHCTQCGESTQELSLEDIAALL